MASSLKNSAQVYFLFPEKLEILFINIEIAELSFKPAFKYLNYFKDSDSQQQLRVAMETIETLKKRLNAKEESVSRYSLIGRVQI